MKLITRADLGWPASAAPSQLTAKGVKVHYEGTHVSPALLDDHDLCIKEWKAIRAAHLANKKEGYSDVAYNYAACPHGFLLEGRGLRRRTGANGNQPLNIAHYAIVGLVGSEGLTEPTDAMLSAIRDGIDLLRKHGAGSEIKGHRDGYATTCPGTLLYDWVKKGAPRPSGQDGQDDTDPPPAGGGTTYEPPAFPTGLRPNSKSPSARGLQKVMKKLGFLAASVPYADNYGPQTQEAVARFHNKYTQFRALGIKHDTAIGPRGWAFAHTKAYGGK
ncbi:peptidoglycan recognition protein family protein [Streptomyces cucumeris]|uniref:peptidoglycan recognition protein family protein n=1 Tax=Streptomyces cucumeris TaxID=2962890 RepID=UPI003D75E09B